MFPNLEAFKVDYMIYFCRNHFMALIFFLQARQVHPDKNPGDPQAAKNFQVIFSLHLRSKYRIISIL